MPPASAPWTDWIAGLGHDTYAYPLWITEQPAASVPLRRHTLAATSQHDLLRPAASRLAEFGRPSAIARLVHCQDVRGCWMEHMPELDLHFLPNSVTVNATSMLDDVIAFS